jgi:hypothetical protein
MTCGRIDSSQAAASESRNWLWTNESAPATISCGRKLMAAKPDIIGRKVW